MDVKIVMEQLSGWTNEMRRKHNLKKGSGENQFGVTMGNLRSYAKKIKTNHQLALDLWETKNIDAMILATMLFDTKQLSKEQIENMINTISFVTLVDEFIFNTISKTPFAAELRDSWSSSDNDYIGRAGWALIIDYILSKQASDDELENYISIVESDLKDAPALKQDSMNRALCEIGIRYPKYREHCLKIGEKLGVYSDEKVAKGCVRRYAPDWIAAVINSPRHIKQ